MGQLAISDPGGDFGCYITSEKAGLYRWQICLGDSSAEADFGITLWNDDATATFTPVSINRETGATTINGDLTCNGTGLFGPFNCNNAANFTGNQNFDIAPGGLGQAGFSSFVMSADENYDCFATYIVNNQFASQFGQSSNGRYYMGGWSYGAAAYQFWTSLDFGNPACDYRIKENIAPLASTWDRVKALKPIRYRQKETAARGAAQNVRPLLEADPRERWGFVAHELQETLGETAATGVKDDPDLIQAPNMNMVVAALTKALQEAMARIEALEARLA
jgi:hypothetical protein